MLSRNGIVECCCSTHIYRICVTRVVKKAYAGIFLSIWSKKAFEAKRHLKQKSIWSKKAFEAKRHFSVIFEKISVEPSSIFQKATNLDYLAIFLSLLIKMLLFMMKYSIFILLESCISMNYAIKCMMVEFLLFFA